MRPDWMVRSTIERRVPNRGGKTLRWPLGDKTLHRARIEKSVDPVMNDAADGGQEPAFGFDVGDQSQMTVSDQPSDQAKILGQDRQRSALRASRSRSRQVGT